MGGDRPLWHEDVNGMAIEAYPLCWPTGWKRTVYRGDSKFKTGFGLARNLLIAELKRMGATKVILSTNIPLRNDGLPRANTRPDGGDPGAAVYFVRKGKNMVFACDKYRKSEDNVYAIAKTIDAMRGIERWGASDMMERAFTGFRALPENSGDGADPYEVLGVNRAATEAEINAAYRAMAKEAHPDTGAHPDRMVQLNLARDRALAALRQAA